MGEVVQIEDAKPHLVIEDTDNNVNVIPVQVFTDIAYGKMKFSELEGFDKLAPQIIHEWMKAKDLY